MLSPSKLVEIENLDVDEGLGHDLYVVLDHHSMVVVKHAWPFATSAKHPAHVLTSRSPALVDVV